MLSEIQRMRLIELDARRSGLIGDSCKTQVQGKSLIIGMGGMGARAISQIKTELEHRTQYSNSDIRLLAIDTDSFGLHALEEEHIFSTPLELGKETFHAFDPILQTLVNSEEMQPVYFSKWMNPDFFYQRKEYRAGGLRQVGRASLLNRYDKLLQLVQDAIRDLNGDGKIGHLNVHIVAGIAGSTGGGMIIDIPNIVRQSYQKMGGDLKYIKICGYILMPVILCQMKGISADHRRQLELVSYAALKELDFYMGIPERRGDLEEEAFEYPKGELVVLENNRLYNACMLYNGKCGNCIVANPDSFAINCVVRTIMACLVCGQISLKTYSDFRISNIGIALSNKNDKYLAQDAYYCYSSSGVGSASLPNEFMMGNAGASVFAKLLDENMQRKRTVTVDEVMTFVSKSLITPIEMIRIIVCDKDYQITLDDDVMPTYRSVSCNEAQYFKTSLLFQKHKLAGMRSQLVNDTLESAIHNFDIQCHDYLLKFGPYVLLQIFEMFREKSNDMTCEGVLQTTRKYKTHFEMILSNLRENEEANYKILEQQIRKAKKAGALRINIKSLHKRDLNRYIYTCIKDAQNSLMIDALDRLKDMIYIFIRHVEKFANECQTLAEVLDETQIILRNSAEQFSQANKESQRYNLNLCDPTENSQMYYWMRAKLDAAIGETNITRLHHEMMDDYIIDPRCWIDNGSRFAAHEKIKRMLNNTLGDRAQITLGDYFDRVEAVEGGGALSNEVNRICCALESLAEPMFHFIPTYPHAARMKSTFIIIPDNLCKQAKNEFFKNANSNTRVLFSSEKDRISILKVVGELPLYAEHSMAEYEQAYTSGNTTFQHINEQLSDEDNLTWKHYPPIISSTIWDKILPGDYRNEDEQQFLDDIFCPLMEKAKHIGLLERSQAGNSAYCARLINEETEVVLNIAERYKEEAAVEMDSKVLFDRLFEAAEKKCTVPVCMYGRSLGNTTGDNEEDFRNACVIIRKHVPLYLRIKKTMKVFQAAEIVIRKKTT